VYQDELIASEYTAMNVLQNDP